MSALIAAAAVIALVAGFCALIDTAASHEARDRAHRRAEKRQG